MFGNTDDLPNTSHSSDMWTIHFSAMPCFPARADINCHSCLYYLCVCIDVSVTLQKFSEAVDACPVVSDKTMLSKVSVDIHVALSQRGLLNSRLLYDYYRTG